MIQPQEPENVESANAPPAPDHCSLLDEYWDALRRESESDLQGLIERDPLDKAIAGDLEVLNLLHQARRVAPPDCGASDFPTAWLSGRVAMKANSAERETGAAIAHRGHGGERSQVTEWIGKYRVLKMLDRGGQAQVFRVFHPELAKECILKLARRPSAIEDEDGRDALRREGKLLAQCDHPNLVRVLDLDVHEGRWFIVMEYYPALTLDQFVARHRPGPRQAARLVIELARAVAYLHARGITHQDIKPQNVLVDDQGRPRLIDLGLARQNHAWCDDADDRTGGTGSYMSPEQAGGRADLIGPRTDVFGLGGLLYYLLTERPLYVGSSAAATNELARKADYIPVRQLKPGASRLLEWICHKALAVDPGRRYPSAEGLARDLRRYCKAHLVAAVGPPALVTLGAVALLLFWLGLRPGISNPPTDALPTMLAVTVTLKVDVFEPMVKRRRGGPKDEAYERVDPSTEPILEDYEVTVTGKLDTPAYWYVIALNPDGKHDLYWPNKETALPSLSAQIVTGKRVFDLNEGPGLQAFVVLASRQQLPPFGEWQDSKRLGGYWKKVAAEGIHGVWEYVDGNLIPSSSKSRSPRDKPDDPRLTPFRDVCEYLQSLHKFEAIRGFAFAVKPKKRPDN
jgi:tRNA A-37 threonylcarbamoyl transferase component Bud32